MDIFSRLKDGLSKTRSQISAILGTPTDFNGEFFDSLEDALISADIGLEFTTEVIGRLKKVSI